MSPGRNSAPWKRQKVRTANYWLFHLPILGADSRGVFLLWVKFSLLIDRRCWPVMLLRPTPSSVTSSDLSNKTGTRAGQLISGLYIVLLSIYIYTYPAPGTVPNLWNYSRLGVLAGPLCSIKGRVLTLRSSGASQLFCALQIQIPMLSARYWW